MSDYRELLEEVQRTYDSYKGSIDGAHKVLQIAKTIAAADFNPLERASLRFCCSSLVINCGSDERDAAMLSAGMCLAEFAQKDATPSIPLYYQCAYNIANAMQALGELSLPTESNTDSWRSEVEESRRQGRDLLRDSRRIFASVAASPGADLRTRSAAYCNLANSLDTSGRWAEAYDLYLRALDIDPANGNAAGNLAQLLLHRINSGVGQTGHVSAVYDKYVKLARSLRDGTVAFAGEATAGRWDDLQETGSLGHLSHGLDGSDPEYRAWVAEHRLALSTAVEGLGSEETHWDGATIEVLYGACIEDMAPPILAEMNVLKSDFLVSRRLAYEGYIQVLEGLHQKSDDTGYYVETLDYSLYGIQYSKLLLAQRSALDVLDKTAVVANEHFALGDRPGGVSFRKFWSSKDGNVRHGLQEQPRRSHAAFALSELAFDMENGGMYAASQALRNAGTHRIVHAALLEATGVTVDTRSRIDLLELIDSTVLALQVTRSAYLYLIDLVAGWNHPVDHPGPRLTFPSYEYMNQAAVGVEENSEMEP